MSVFEKNKRYNVINPAQHILVHDMFSVAYTNPAFPLVNTFGGMLDYIVAVLYPNIKTGVATVGDLPLVGNTLYDFRTVLDDGDGHASAYRWVQLEGEVSASWHKVYDFDWGSGDILSNLYSIAQDQFAVKNGSQDRDASGSFITGLYAGQKIYGGLAAAENLTLCANSGDGVGAHTGYVQVDDNFRATVNETYTTGTSTFRWLKSFQKASEIGFLTISDGINKSLVTSTEPEIDFAALNLTTTGKISTGTIDIATSCDIAGFTFSDAITPSRGKITHSSGLIDFDNEDLSTTGSISGTSFIAALDLTLALGSIKSASGAISFDNENLSTTGTLGAGITTVERLNVNNISIDNNSIISTNTNGNIELVPDGTGKVDIQKALLTLGITTTGVNTITGQLNADNIRIDGNSISSTDLDGNITLTPNGTGVIEATADIRPSTDNTKNIGDSTHRVKEIFASGSIKDGTNTFNISDLMLLKGCNTKSGGGTPAEGDVLIFKSGAWIADVADAEVNHTLISGLTGGAAGDGGHSQFAMLTGRSGGQTVQGGTGATNDLLLESTSHATKGLIKVKDSIVPNSTAAFSLGVWSGTDVGGSSNYFKDVYSKGEFKGLRLENFTEITKPSFSAQNIGRMFYCTDSETAYIDTGTRIKAIGSGGGGGSSLLWHISSSSSAPEEAQLNDVETWAFEVGQTQELWAEYKVPKTYVAGSPLTIYVPIMINSSTTANNIKFKITAYLIRMGVDAITSTANTTNVSTEKTVLGTANIPQEFSFEITADGEINSIPIDGNLIKLKIERVAASSSDDSADALILVNGSEVTIS